MRMSRVKAWLHDMRSHPFRAGILAVLTTAGIVRLVIWDFHPVMGVVIVGSLVVAYVYIWGTR